MTLFFHIIDGANGGVLLRPLLRAISCFLF